MSLLFSGLVAQPVSASEPTPEPPPIADEVTYTPEIVYGDSSLGTNPGAVFYFILHNALGGGGTSVCGGTAISATWILTAAHCVEDSAGIDSIEALDIFTSWTAGSPRIVVAEVIVHPGYDSGTVLNPRYANDIALLRLSSAIGSPIGGFSESFGSHTLSGVLGAYGWGQNEFGMTANILQTTTLQHASGCPDTDVSLNDTDCWVSVGGGQGMYCFGDSGTGGFIGSYAETIVSYGSENCDSYAVTTRISQYAPWITAETGVVASSTRTLPTAQLWWGDDDAYQMVGSTATAYVFSADGTSTETAASMGPDVGTITDVDSYRSSGYRAVLDDDGRVYTNEPSVHFGEIVGQLRSGETSTGISFTPDGQGYWIFTSLGRVFTFGNAVDYGDMDGITLNGPVVDAVPTPSGNGYYMVGSDGGIFSFGDANFAGSMGGIPLNSPVNGIVPDPDGVGYWLVAGDGGVFSFSATFMGSMGGTPLNQPIVGMVSYGDAYLMVASDGGVFNFSAKPFYGSLGDNPPSNPIVSISVSSVP